MESESDATVSPNEDGFMPHVEMIFKGRKKIDSDIEEAEDVEQPFQEMPEIGPEGDYQEPLHFVSREEWGALPPKDPIPNDKFPLKYVVYTMSTRRHTCLARADCIGVLQRLQKKHMNEGMSDIAYNFLVGRDGTVYEGRGWSTKSSKSLKFNPALYGRRLDIAFIGDYDTVYNPPLDMLEGSQNIQRLGIEENYLLDGHEIVRIYTWRNRVREGRIGEFPTAEEWLYQKYHPPDEFQLPPILQKFFRTNSSPEVLTMWLDESELGPGDVDMILHNVTREEWRALPPRGLHRPRHPFKLVLDHYTYTEPCYSYQQCMREVQQMQRQHMDEGFSDIKYHFLIGGDGNVYEGRGWGKCSSRALRTFVKLWRRRLDIAFIGDYTGRKIPDIMQTRYEHIITYGVHFNMIRIFCNRLHVGKNIMDYVPLECEVRRTTRKKPPRSERPRKKKKKKPKESSDLSFHSNTDLNTDTADSPDTSDREELPFTSTYESSDSTETSDSTKTSGSTGKSDSKRESDSSSASDDTGVTKSEIYSSETTAPEESGDNDNEYEEKYDPQKELRKIADKVDKESKIRGEPIELFSFS